ncbi:TetR/AcrR family transcriptional regulator [Specibacter sp. AOP5-B1-6]|uniref:TetR/AcrR family transcriptional regulator n=1 Tax=Specibacter sp. AOP5-B1-6 TaxID=3457653 RepID=UPI00402B8C08
MTTHAPRPAASAPAHDAAAVLGRRYSGMQSSERAMERRGRLIEAGIDVFGTAGYPAAKIKTLCQSAGLSERYFYESFESREQLLTAVYDELATQLMQEVTEALRAPEQGLLDSVRAGLAAVVNFMLGDPRHAQIILVEIVGVSAELEAKRHQSMTAFAAESMRLLLLLSGIDPKESQRPLTASAGDLVLAEALDFARLTGVAMVGGVNNILLDALLGGTSDNTELITEVSFQLLCNASTGIRGIVTPGGHGRAGATRRT